MVMLLAVTTCSWRWLESFPATKTRLLAVLLIALQCVIPHFMPWSLRENVAAKALSHQIVDLQPPNVAAFGRLLGRMEEGKGQAYSTGIDVPCSDRNRLIPEAHSHCHWRAWHEVFCHA